MSKIRFVPDIWIAFYAQPENVFCIGRTFFGPDIEGNEQARLVAIVSVDGRSGYISFDLIENPINLKIDRDKLEEIFNEQKQKLSVVPNDFNPNKIDPNQPLFPNSILN